MYGRTGRMTAIDGRVDELAAVLLEASSLMADVAGAIHYIVGVDGDDVVVSEVWESPEAHAASLASPEVRALIARGVPLIAGMGDGASFDVLGGLGLP